MSLSSGAYLGSHSTVSQWARAARAARESLLTWIGPLSSTRPTTLAGWHGQARKGRPGELSDVDRPIILDEHDRLGGLAGHGAEEPVELLQMRHKVAAAFGRAGVDDELPRAVIERAQHRDLLCLSRSRHAQVGAGLGPGSGEIGMGQRLALIAIEQHDVAGFGLALAQLPTQAHPLDLDR